MALILEQANAQRKVWRNVKIETPKENGGYREDQFRAQFQLMDADTLKDQKDEQIPDFLKTVITDVTGVKQAEGEEDDLPFTTELVDQLVAVPWIRSKLMQEYLLIPAGKKGQVKN